MKKVIKILCSLLAVIMVIETVPSVFAMTSSYCEYTDTTYTHQSKFDGSDIVYGIDVSQHNDSIDFDAVKDDGIDFVFVRVGYTGYTKEKLSLNYDTNYKTNISNAIDAGLAVGVYWYSQALNEDEATKEANKLLSAIGDYDINMPVVYDYEFADVSTGRLDSANLSKAQMTANSLAFLNTVSSAGYDACFYANENFLKKKVNASEISDEYEVWLANYSTSTSYSGDYDFWQFTSNGRVDGIDGRVDVNFWYSGDELTNLDTQVYTGSPITPEPVVTINGITLTKDVDYTLTYADNVEVGIASVTATGIGNYAGQTQTFKFKIQPPQVTGLTYVSATDTSLSYTWTPVTGATSYTVYGTNLTNGNTFTKTVTSNSCTLNNLTPGNQYSVKVRAAMTNSKGRSYLGAASEACVNNTTGSKITGLKVKSRTNTTITLKWNKLSSCDSYNIYKYNSSKKKYYLLAQTSGNTNTYKVSKLKAGTAYRFKVSANQSGTEGTKSSALKTATTPKKVTVKSAKSYSKKRITYKWKKVTASGYQVQWSTTKNFKKNYKSKTTSKTSYKIKTAQSKKKYYVRVRAYKKDENGNKVYGAWSKVKSLKVK